MEVIERTQSVAAPRWYIVVVSLVLINAALVSITSMRHVWAQTPQQEKDSDQVSKTAASPAVEAENDGNSPLSDLPIPDELPQVPSHACVKRPARPS